MCVDFFCFPLKEDLFRISQYSMGFLNIHLWMKPAFQKSLLHLQERVWGGDPADSPALQPLHVHRGVHQVALQDLGGERIEGLQVKVVRE